MKKGAASPPPLPPPAPSPCTTHTCLIPLVDNFGVCRRCRVGKCAKISGPCEGSTSTAVTPLPWYLLNSCEIVAPVRLSAQLLSPRAECCIPSASLSEIIIVMGSRTGPWCVVRILRCRPVMLKARTDRGCIVA